MDAKPMNSPREMAEWLRDEAQSVNRPDWLTVNRGRLAWIADVIERLERERNEAREEGHRLAHLDSL